MQAERRKSVFAAKRRSTLGGAAFLSQSAEQEISLHPLPQRRDESRDGYGQQNARRRIDGGAEQL